ncbi:MAG: hypothetical protein ACQEQC_02410 [Elusimicrobiota bacterium]
MYTKKLAGSTFKTLKESFPHTLEMYDKKTYIIASHNRTFATSFAALYQFLNTLDNMPEFVTPAFLRYMLSTQKEAKKFLHSDTVTFNTDHTPASLQYSFSQFVLFSNLLPNSLIIYMEYMDLVYLYFFTFIFIFLLFIKSKKDKNIISRIDNILIMKTFNTGVFLYILIIITQTIYGEIFSHISIITAGLLAGAILSFFLLKKQKKYPAYSKLKICSLITGVLLILITILFKTLLSDFGIVTIILISLIGGILSGSNFTIINEIYRNSEQQVTPQHISFILTGSLLLACLAAVFIIPFIDIIWVLTALGIISFSEIIILKA